MSVVRVSGHVAAPRDRIFTLLEDSQVAPTLDPDFISTDILEAPWLPAPGSRTRRVLTYRGVVFELETEIQEYRRGYFLLEHQVAGPFLRFEHAVNLEDDEAGTKITEVLAYAPRFRALGWLFDRLALKADLTSLLASRQQRLRELLEQAEEPSKWNED